MDLEIFYMRLPRKRCRLNGGVTVEFLKSLILPLAVVILAAAIITMSRLSKKIRREIREIDAKLRECEDRLDTQEVPEQT
jgi:hypothetical protein